MRKSQASASSQPAPEREAGDGRDRGPGDVGDGVQGPQEVLPDELGLGPGDDLVGRLGRPELGDLGARREDAVAAGDDDGARRVVAQRGGGGLELLEQLLGQRVDLGVVEADDGDAVVPALDDDEGRLGHGRLTLLPGYSGRKEPLGGRPGVERCAPRPRPPGRRGRARPWRCRPLAQEGHQDAA